MSIRYDGQVAIVTGAGNGLGKSHALALAARPPRNKWFKKLKPPVAKQWPMAPTSLTWLK